jgi:hypothetical protein
VVQAQQPAAAAAAAAATMLAHNTKLAAVQQRIADREHLLQQLPDKVRQQPAAKRGLKGKDKQRDLAKARAKAVNAAAEALLAAVCPIVAPAVPATQQQQQLEAAGDSDNVNVLLRVLWHVKADRPDAEDAADGEQNRANTYMKIVRVLKKVFGDCWLVPRVLTVKQMYTYINKQGGYSKEGGRWHDSGAHVEVSP